MDCLKGGGGAWTVYRFKGGGKKEGGLRGGLIPQCTLCHKSWMERCFPFALGFSTEVINIASTSLQQRQSISLASVLQSLHLHQSRFPILILYVINQQLKPEYFSCLSMVENGGAKDFVICHGDHTNFSSKFQDFTLKSILMSKILIKTIANLNNLTI